MKSRFTPKYFLMALLGVGVFAVVFSLSGDKAYAASGTCYFTGGACNIGAPGYGNDVLPGRVSAASPDTIPAGAYSSKAALVNYIENKYDAAGATLRQKRGAAFLMNKIVKAGIGSNPARDATPGPASALRAEFEARMALPTVSLSVDFRDLDKTSFWDPGQNDDFVDTSYTSFNRRVLIIQVNGTDAIIIETACGNFTGGSGIPKPSDFDLDGVKIDNSGAGIYGGSTAGSYYNDPVTLSGDGTTTANPFYFDSETPAGVRNVSVNDDSDSWDVIGYAICEAGAGCTSAWLANPANRNPGTSFNFNFQGGKSYHMRWINARVPPIGSFDGLSCAGANGWTFDPSISSASINVDVYLNDAYVTTVAANQGGRPDVNAAYGIAGNHAFSFAITSLPGFDPIGNTKIDLYAKGINRSGAQDGVDAFLGSRTIGPCLAGTCIGSYPSSADNIRADTSPVTTATFRNDGTFAWDYGGRVTARRVVNGAVDASGVAIPPTGPGGAPTISYGALYIPKSLSTINISFQLVLDGSRVFANCAVPVNPYTEFVLTPTLQNIVPGTGAFQDPATVKMTSTVGVTYTQAPGPPIDDPNYVATRTLIKNNLPFATFFLPNQQGPFVAPSYPYNDETPTVGVPSLNDRYCGNIKLSHTTGWINGLGNIVNVGGGPVTDPPVAGDCTIGFTVTNQPYFKAYGGDVVAGGCFTQPDGSCVDTYGKIKANTEFSAGKGGSSTDLAARAYDIIDSFASASRRFAVPVAPTGLTFANTATPPGNYGAGTRVKDYFTDTQFQPGDARINIGDATRKINLTPGGSPSGEQTIFGTGSVVTVQGTGSTGGLRHTVYVDGDVYIPDNIVSDDNLGNNLADAPYITVVVRGNIFIKSSVQRLDGLYIAQPRAADPTKGGGIYTCRKDASAGWALSNEMRTQCDNQLVVNGSFVAQHVYLQRTNGSLRYGFAHEGPNDPSAFNIAEIFNATPDFFVGQPVFRSETKTADSIKSLPPVF